MFDHANSPAQLALGNSVGKLSGTLNNCRSEKVWQKEKMG